MSETIAVAVERRRAWIPQLTVGDTAFSVASARLLGLLRTALENDGPQALYEHLLFCGAIPESLSHDSSEEKLYAKYTDMVLALTFESLGLVADVLDERSDAADVGAECHHYRFVADAKAFRLSRTAKNQKDFKVESMAGWKGDRDYALVVAPLYQFPTTYSQIYEQATRRHVAILSYAHLRLLLAAQDRLGLETDQLETLIRHLLQVPQSLETSKDAKQYWSAVRRSLIEFSEDLGPIWEAEVELSEQALEAAKREELTFLQEEIEAFKRLSHEEAIQALVQASGLSNRLDTISKTSETPVFYY